MNKDILVKDILEITNGKLLCGDLNIVCDSFSKDTRQINEGDIYLGIKGERFNGSVFYKEALEKGAKGCILQDIEIPDEELTLYKDKFIILVNNVVESLQKIAIYKRNLYNIPVIGITGSVGKTSTKDMIASVLETEYKVLKTEGNYNNEIGLPLTILKLKDHDALVLEMGMSALGEISLLTNIAKPTGAVITTIGTSHIGELGSRENILKAKLEILEGLGSEGTLIFNNDNDMLNIWNKDNTDNHNHICYGIDNKSNINAYDIHTLENGSNFKIKVNNEGFIVNVPISGRHFVYNALAAICVGLDYGINIHNILKGIENFTLTGSRMEILKNNKSVTIINDCYNASYESIKAAIDYLSTLKDNRKIAVLGDVLELGSFSHEVHKNIGEYVASSKVNILITVGNEAEITANTVRDLNKDIVVYSYKQNDEACSLLKEIMKENDAILVKASNGMNFKEIVKELIEI